MKFKFSHKFISDSFWSLFGNLISVIAGLFAIKIITKLVVADDYGKASLVLGVVALLHSLLIGPLMAAHMRIYFDYLKRETARWYALVFNWILGGAGLILLLLYILVAYGYNFRGNRIFLVLLAPAVLLILAQPYLNALTSYLEAHRQQKKLAIVNMLQKALFPIILFFLLLITAMSPENAIIISQGLAVILLLIFFRAPEEQKNSNKQAVNTKKELINLKNSLASYGCSLPLGYVVMWIMTTGDRYLIEHFLTMKDVGLYAMNYGFWSLPYFLLNGWLEILTRPLLYDKAAKDNWHGVKHVLLLRITFGLIISVLGTVFFYIMGEQIASIILGRNYWGGWQLMMYVATAHCFMVIGYSVLPVFLAGKKTNMILLATSGGALSNIGINLVVIPLYGIIGAAMSTMIAYIIWAVVLITGAYFFMQHLISRQDHMAEEKNAT